MAAYQELEQVPGIQSIPLTSPFRLVCRALLLIYHQKLELNILSELIKKFHGSQILTSHFHENTCLLIVFNKRFETRKSKLFDLNGLTPTVYQIDARQNKALRHVKMYLFGDNKGNHELKQDPQVVLSTAYRKLKIELEHPWQENAYKLIERSLPCSSVSPLINFVHPIGHPSIAAFIGYACAISPVDILHIDGFSPVDSKAKVVTKAAQIWWTGKIMMIQLNTKEIEVDWPKRSQVIQSIRSGILCGKRPNLIFIFSTKPITFGSIGPDGIRCVNLSASAGHFGPVKEEPTISLTEELFGSSAKKIERETCAVIRKAQQILASAGISSGDTPIDVDKKYPFPSDDDDNEDELPPEF